MSTGRVLSKLLALSKIPSPGPAPAFTHVHIGQAILLIGDHGRIGRIELSRRLGIGEGATRTIIKHLTQAKVVETGPEGCGLTQRGAALYRSLRSTMSNTIVVDARQLALDKVSAAIMVRGSGEFLRRGIEQRDAAIRTGAAGACSLIFRGRDFLMPMSESDEWKLSTEDPLFEQLTTAFHPRKNDVVVISSGPDKALAERGVIAAALTLAH